MQGNICGVWCAVPTRFAAILGWAVFLFLILTGNRTCYGWQQDRADQYTPDDFKTRVLPLLKQHCFYCHGMAKIRGGLELTNHSGLLAGGESGPAIDVDSPQDSLLLKAIRYEGYEMPPSGKLSDKDIATLTEWVMAGAPWPGQDAGPDSVDKDSHSAPTVNLETKKWWSFQKVVRPKVPRTNAVSDETTNWAKNEIDHFILKRLQDKNLKPAPQASKQTLARRAWYDLTGLPPTPDQIAEFVSDDSPDAWPRLVDRLLDSPHYGEKWGRHWLDVVRYAESNSYERDGTKPFVWRYRDYVIRSFNQDKPYDEFLKQQLAGDEMEPVTPEQIIATGYYRLGLWDDEPADPRQAWYDDMDDVLATTSQGMLGLTLDCARCHDHKIDPVPQTDYYRFLAFFRNVRRYGVRSHPSVVDASVRVIASADQQKKYKQETQQWNLDVRENKQAMEEIERLAKEDFIPVEHEDFRDEANRVRLITKRAGSLITDQQADDYKRLFDEMKRLRSSRPASLESALAVKETGSNPLKTHVLVRGNAEVQGPEVQPGFPSVLSPPNPKIEVPGDGKSTGRRLALANWITSPDNPLTARVMVNRIWQHHFGRGIVRSSSDFGFQGTVPTHPLLLDWLASEFVKRGWSIKSMHRLIMNSAAYQMSSKANSAALAVDPVNDSFWRFDARRLTAEEIRDSILAVCGNLNRDKMYGPSVFPIIPPQVLHGQSMPGNNWGDSSEEDRFRRSIYIHIKRSLPVPLLASFDVAETDTPCPVRFNTVQPTQALGMINSDFLKRQSQLFAEKIRSDFPDDLNQQVTAVLRRVTQRPPTGAEVEMGTRFINAVLSDSKDAPDSMDARREALRQFCLIALNLNEFLFLD